MRWLSYLEKKLIFTNDKQDIFAVKNSPMSPFKNLQVYACVCAWVLMKSTYSAWGGGVIFLLCNIIFFPGLL